MKFSNTFMSMRPLFFPLPLSHWFVLFNGFFNRNIATHYTKEKHNIEIDLYMHFIASSSSYLCCGHLHISYAILKHSISILSNLKMAQPLLNVFFSIPYKGYCISMDNKFETFAVM